MRNLQQVQVRTSSGFEKICPFPVGYIYMSTNSTSPASTYGGTWSALTDSRFLRPSGSWGSLGGSETHTHWTNLGKAAGEGTVYFADDTSFAGQQSRVTKGVGGALLGVNRLVYAQNNEPMRQGSTAPESTLPSYRTCYAWYRTA